MGIFILYKNTYANLNGGNKQMRLLIVEDEEAMQKALCKSFRKLGYTVDSASDGEEALNQFFTNVYDLVVLDLNLPKLCGMSILKKIRADNKETPVLILSARSETDIKISGFNAGANDFLAKPFHFGELEARVRALLRRNFKTADAAIEIGGVKMDTATKRVFVSDEEISLTKKEYAILNYLFSRNGESVATAELVERLWDSDSDESFNSFKVRLSALRKKLPEGFIKNSRGHGYYVE